MEDNKTTVAAEPAVAYRTTSYMDAMEMIHTMHLTREDKERVGRRLVVETTEANLSKAFDTLDHLSTLQFGWDGYNALPISRKVINNLRSVLLISDSDDWKNWMISPDGNATLGLQSKPHTTLISVGADEFSYLANIDGRRYGESHVPFTPEALLSIMRKYE